MNKIVIALVICLAAILWLSSRKFEPSKLIEQLKPKPKTGGIPLVDVSLVRRTLEMKTGGIPQINVELAMKHLTLYESPSIPDSRKYEIIDKLEKEEKAGYRTSKQTEEYSAWLAGVEEYRATKETWFEKAGGVF